MKFLNILLIFLISTCLKAQDKPLNITAPLRVLYVNCVNDLQILIPNLKAEDIVSCEVKGAHLIKNKSKTEIKLIPFDTLVELKFFKNSILYKKREFKTMLIPIPQIKLFINDSLLDYKVGAQAASLRKIQLRLFPDEWVFNNLPDEVDYTIAEFTISLARGMKSIFFKTIQGNSMDLSLLAALAKPGDRFVIKIDTVKRMSYQKVYEDIPYNRVCTVSLF